MFHLRRAAAALAAGAAVLAAAPAMSADAASDAHKLELARHLFSQMNMPQIMDAVTKSMGASMLASLRKANPSLSDEQARAIGEATAESAREMMPKIMDRMVPLYASTFSEKELSDAAAFYDSPSGKAMLAKMPTLMSQLGPIMQEVTPQMMTDLRRRICAKTDCSKLAPPPKG